jgi:plastocyanin
MSSRFARYGSRALGAALLLSQAGCGGKGTEVDDARVIAEPGTNPSGPGSTSSASTAAPAAAAPAATSTPATAAPAAAVKAEGWGTLKGRVVFDGDPPPQKILVPKGSKDAKDAAVCATHEIKAERLVVDAGTKGVKNVIVYIPKPTAVNPEAKSAKASQTVLFDQKGCVFEPHVLAAMVGEKIDLKSSDPVSHNINCKVQNNSFNEAVAPNGEIKKQAIAPARMPGLVTCDIHPWMTAYWLVLDNPYFAVTDDKGNFEIKNAPAGTQKVVVWQEATQFVTPSAGQDVTLAAGGDASQDFTIKASQVKPE